jgi:hypothetical protein
MENLQTNWDHPLSQGVEVPSFEKAQSMLAFSVREPLDLTKPVAIFVASNDTLASLYDTDCGRVIVYEVIPSPAEGFDAGLQTIVDQINSNPSNKGLAEIVNIRDGQTAMLLSDSDLTHLEWEESGVDFIIRGPKISPDQALNVAAGL